jgi:hypothetical protein
MMVTNRHRPFIILWYINDILLKVKEYKHKPKLYEPREVFNFMKEKNPHLAELVKVLGGEISY